MGQNKPVTLQQLKEELEDLLMKHPELANAPVIYSSDQEGNSYHKIWNPPTRMQVEDVEEHDLEIIDDGFAEDCNCICIN